jgi:hypothetical protein
LNYSHKSSAVRPKEEWLGGQTRKTLVVALVWPVVVPVRRGILVAVEQEVPVAEPSVAEPAADASILLAVPVAVLVAAVAAVAASSTPAAVLPTLPAMAIEHSSFQNDRNTHLHSFLLSLLLIGVE